MKRILTSVLIAATAFGASALPKAFYVKQGDTYTKYNFGVAGDLWFSKDGKSLTVTGYAESINLDKIDYITFTAPVQQSLTSSEHKARLITIGEEINKRIDLYKVEDALLMGRCFTRSDRTNDWYSYAEYDVPEEYWDVFNEFGSSAMRVASGDVSAIGRVRAGATNLYKIEDYTGIYNANRETHSWERIAEADYFEMRFQADDGDDYVVRLTPSKEYTTYVTPEYRGQMPRSLEILLAKGDSTIASGVVRSELKQDELISIETEVSCGGYVVNDSFRIGNEGMTGDITVTVEGEKLVTSSRKVDGRNLLVYDEMYDDIRDSGHWHDADGNCMGDDPTALLSHFIRANASADVLGQLQIKGKALNFNKLYESMGDTDSNGGSIELGDGRYVLTKGWVLSSNADNSIVTVTWDNVEADEVFVRDLNNYSDITFHYDNKPEIQGYLTFDISEYVNENTYWYDPNLDTRGYTVVEGRLVTVYRVGDQSGYGPWVYTVCDRNDWSRNEQVTVDDDRVIKPTLINEVAYEIQPLLTFPDQTSFAFEDFFDEHSFDKLINDYQDIIETYDNIMGRDHDEY